MSKKKIEDLEVRQRLLQHLQQIQKHINVSPEAQMYYLLFNYFIVHRTAFSLTKIKSDQ